MMRISRSINSLVVLVLGLGSSSALADELTHGEVIESIRASFPKIKIAEQKVVEASGKVTESEGAFDLSLSGEGEVQPEGFYQNRSFKAKLEQPTRLWGTKLYGGWRWSDGNFPTYEGKRVTGAGGEFLAGLQLPLLRGGKTDEKRTKINEAQADEGAAEAAAKWAEVLAVFEGSIKYWEWVGAVKKLEIARGLRDVATDRRKWLKTKVKLGDMPKYELIDNQRTIVSREAKVVEAERKAEASALGLSMYLLGPGGKSRVPRVEEAPEEFPAPRLVPELTAKRFVETAIKAHPELSVLRANRSRAQASLDLAENQLLPAVDLYGEVSRDTGATDVTRFPTEFRAGLRLNIPLQRREAKGRRASGRAELLQIDQKTQFLTTRVRVQVQQSMARLKATYQQVELAKEEVGLNEELVRGEQARFSQGASHIMFVNLREVALVDAQERLIDALAAHQQGLAELNAVMGRVQTKE